MTKGKADTVSKAVSDLIFDAAIVKGIQDKRELIKPSVQHFLSGGNVNGEFHMAIKKLLRWTEKKVMEAATEAYAQTESKWIAVEDGLPENDKSVLGTNGKALFVCYYTRGHEIPFDDFDDYDTEYDPIEDKAGTLFLKPGWYELEEQRNGDYDYCYMNRPVTHWQPLPTPPNPQEVKP